ncbi:MAG: hypothetical protein JWL77_7077 [Chthonomonadaceae bacterium]|nr:hypothetical protein [Chthonomonadaceae bacterium]
MNAPMSETTEWIEGDWDDDLLQGQIVRLENTDGSVLPGKVLNDTGCSGGCGTDVIATSAVTKTLDVWRANGWSLFVEAPTKPELPSEPGYYVGEARGSGVTPLMQLGASGEWFYIGNEHRPCGLVGIPKSHTPDRFLPLTRLEPVAETLSRYMPRLEEAANCIGPSNHIRYETSTRDIMRGRAIIRDLISEFKVQP